MTRDRPFLPNLSEQRQLWQGAEWSLQRGLRINAFNMVLVTNFVGPNHVRVEKTPDPENRSKTSARKSPTACDQKFPPNFFRWTFSNSLGILNSRTCLVLARRKGGMPPSQTSAASAAVRVADAAFCGACLFAYRRAAVAVCALDGASHREPMGVLLLVC